MDVMVVILLSGTISPNQQVFFLLKNTSTGQRYDFTDTTTSNAFNDRKQQMSSQTDIAKPAGFLSPEKYQHRTTV
jgi:hypothetical protein